MAYRLPLFPLELALFPGMPQPLHIFEPRYRRMLQDCLDGDGQFGIIPMPGGDVPVTGAVGCAAEIRATQALEDGRSNILVQGRERFTLEELLDGDTPYHLGMVTALHDTDADTISAERVEALTRLGREYLDALQALTDASLGEVTWSADAEEASLQAAALLEADLAVKRELLAMQSARRRIGIVQRLLQHQATVAAERAAIHRHARTNGRGHPDGLPDEAG